VEADKAIVENNQDRFSELFQFASEVSNKDMRLKLIGVHRQEILVKLKKGKYGSQYLFQLSGEQYISLAKAGRCQFRFTVENK
jgi:hypothetical protein